MTYFSKYTYVSALLAPVVLATRNFIALVESEHKSTFSNVTVPVTAVLDVVLSLLDYNVAVTALSPNSLTFPHPHGNSTPTKSILFSFSATSGVLNLTVRVVVDLEVFPEDVTAYNSRGL